MEYIELEIRRVLHCHHNFSFAVRAEEARIDAVGGEIRALEGRIRAEDAGELELQRMRNLVTYQATLVERAASRTELLRALDEDLLLLFVRRRQLWQWEGIGASGVDAIANVSLSSGLSSGDDDNDGFQNDCLRPASVDVIRMRSDQNNLDELTTEEAHLSEDLLVPGLSMENDAVLTREDGRQYHDLLFKRNILDNNAVNILDPDANIDKILKDAMKNSDLPSEGIQGSKKAPKRCGRVANYNIARRLRVDFDGTGSPIGPNAGAFKRSINSYVCHFLPVRFKQISDVPADDYKSVLNVLTERYNFDVNGSYTRKKISSCYRQHKYKLLVRVKKDFEKGVEPEKPSYVKKDDWDAFVAKTKDEEFDRISKKNKASRCSVHKRKLGSEELMNEYVYTKVPKPKRGHKKAVSAIVSDSPDAMQELNEMLSCTRHM